MTHQPKKIDYMQTIFFYKPSMIPPIQLHKENKMIPWMCIGWSVAVKCYKVGLLHSKEKNHLQYKSLSPLCKLVAMAQHRGV